jgi:ADP-ribosylglycohydrolase
MPNAAVTPLHVVLHHEWLREQSGSAGAASPEEAEAMYTAAIRDALAAGGCCASRAGVAGACLGALLGPAAVPAAWHAKTAVAQDVADMFALLRCARGC